MNLQELRNKPREWKVLSSTYAQGEKKKEMIGGIYEEHSYNRHNKTVSLYTKDKKGYRTFNLSDLQEMTPLSYKGTRIGIGDEVEYCGDLYEVYDYCWCVDNWAICTALDKDYNYTAQLYEEEIEAHKPLYASPKETIIIGGITYVKKEVEERLKDLKALGFSPPIYHTNY